MGWYTRERPRPLFKPDSPTLLGVAEASWQFSTFDTNEVLVHEPSTGPQRRERKRGSPSVATVSGVDPIMALERATSAYRQRLTAIESESWSNQSVCDAWTIRDIADHVTGGNRFAVSLLAGHSAREAIGTAMAAGFEDDPLSSYDISAAAQLDAFRAPGSLDMVVHHPDGDIHGRQFLGFRLGDLLLHGWDLARSTGGDENLDPRLVPLVWDAYQPSLGTAEKLSTFGDGPSGDSPTDAPLALRLLDLTGRRP